MAGVYIVSPAAAAFHCPADSSTAISDNSVRRTRSYTLNGWMNTSQDDQGLAQGFGYTLTDFREMPHKMSQIVRPSPVGTFIFIDEQEKSIDDGLWNSDPSALVASGVAVLKRVIARMAEPSGGSPQSGPTSRLPKARRYHKWRWPNRIGNMGLARS